MWQKRRLLLQYESTKPRTSNKRHHSSYRRTRAAKDDVHINECVSQTDCPVRDAELFIADEIAIRHHKCSENQNIKIRHTLLGALSNLADRELDNRTPTPVFIGLN
jgi:hypothetical protein